MIVISMAPLSAQAEADGPCKILSSFVKFR